MGHPAAGGPPAGTKQWAALGVPTIRLAGPHDGLHRQAIRDPDGTLTRWLQRKKAAAVVLRPDGFIYAAAGSGQPLPTPPAGFTANASRTPTRTSHRIPPPTPPQAGGTPDRRTVTVAGKPIFFAEAGTGPAVVMLHGGGPGASGASNYSRNIDALAKNFRVIVPDMPGYGRSTKGVDQSDPFGYLADMIRGLLDELGIDTAHLIGNSYGGAAALRLALDTTHRVGKLVLMGPGGIGTTRGVPTAGLKRLLSYYGGDGPSRVKLETLHPHAPRLRRGFGARRGLSTFGTRRRSTPR